MKFVLSVLVLTVSLSVAGSLTETGGEPCGTTWQGFDAETVYLSQPPTGNAMASQYFTDYYPSYDAGVADDVEFSTTTTINRIRWWGGYWNGTTTVPIDCAVEIYLYADDGTGNAPTLPQHTSAISSWMVTAGSYAEVADGSNYRCEYDFPTAVVFDANVKYWIEIRKSFPFSPDGQYGWIESEPVNMSPCVQGFDGLGTVWWTARATDAAFELVFDDAISLNRSTWASIKRLF